MLRASDHQALLDFIDCLYAVPNRAGLIRALCDKLRCLIPFSRVVFLPKDPQTTRFMVDGRSIPDSSGRAFMAYFPYYAPLDPFAVDNRPCTVCWGNPVGAIGLYRQMGDRNFSDREIEIMRRLVPHLSRALHLIELKRVWKTVSASRVNTVREGSAVKRESRATEAVDGIPSESIPDPGLDPAARFAGSRSRTFRVRTVDGQGRERRILLQSVPPGSPRDISARYGLSARQAEITRLVLRGLSNREIGDRLCITEQTVKDHLREVFLKLGVSRRSALAAKVFGLCDVS